MTFFRQQFFPVAVCALLMQHKDGLAWGIVNLAIAALVVLAISGVLHLVRKP